MKHLSLRILLGLFVFSSLAFADGELQVSIRSEESQWIVEQIAADEEGWPEIVERRLFPTLEQAKQYQAQVLLDKKIYLKSETEFSPLIVAGVLWPTKQVWSEDWEKAYAQWIEQEVDADFFVRNNIATDCADVAYALRWIFSRIHGLPAANYLGSSKILLTNETLRSEWSKLPTHADWKLDKRFRAALDYLLRMTYTHTLWKDSFPVALNAQAMLSGSYHLSLQDSTGHTQVIHWLKSQSGVPFLTLNSTVPRRVRSLIDSVLFASLPQKDQSGILRFRWPVKSSKGVSLKPAKEMPGYSQEQFQIQTDKDFTLYLFEKLGYSGDLQELVDFLYKDIFEMMKERKKIVEDGFAICQKTNCAPGSRGWEDWGTPSRDSRLLGKITSVQGIASYVTSTQIQNEVINTEGLSWNLGAVIWNWNKRAFSSDPRDSVVIRWGAGHQSWLQGQVDFFKDVVQQRYERLQLGEEICRKKNCNYGTSGWTQTNVDDLDEKLYHRISYLQEGGPHLPSQLLTDWSARTSEILLSSDSYSLKIQDIIDNRMNMNSAATVSFARQWGLQSEKPVVRVSSASAETYFSRWIWDRSNGRILDRQTAIPLPLDGKVLTAFHKVPVIIIRGTTDYVAVHLETGAQASLPKELWGMTLEVSASDRLVGYKTQAETHMYDLDPQSLGLKKVYRLADGTTWYLVGENDLMMSISGKMFDLIHLRLISSGAMQLVHTDAEKIVMAVGKELRIISRATLQVKTLPLFSETLVYMDSKLNFLVASNGKESQFSILGSAYEVLAEQKVPGYCHILKSHLIQCMLAEVVSFYSYQNGKIHLEKSEKGLAWLNEDFSITRDGASTKLVSRGTGKTLIQSPGIFVLREGIIGVQQPNGFMHAFYLDDLNVPALTNTFNPGLKTNFKNDGQNLLFTNYDTPEEQYYWKTDIR